MCGVELCFAVLVMLLCMVRRDIVAATFRFMQRANGSVISFVANGSFAMVVFRVGACLAVAYGGAQALPPITVQYEQSPPSAGRFVAGGDFKARAARLAERIGHAGGQFAAIGRARPASFVSEVVGSSASFHSFAVQFPNVSAAALRAAFRGATADALQAEGLPLSEAQCVRDYNAPCPLGWVDLGDGGSCTAPVSYEGPCGGELSFGGLAAHEKMQLADSCGVAFACVGACTADYSQPCPGGWSVDAAGACAAPADYAGPCVGRTSFAQLAVADKAVFENACAVQWPCRRPWSKSQRPSEAQTCNADYAKQCPRGWSSRGEVCVAPVSYAGPCSVVWAFGGYSAEEKRVVSDKCGAPWPCAA